jgi:hypothetical protein
MLVHNQRDQKAARTLDDLVWYDIDQGADVPALDNWTSIIVDGQDNWPEYIAAA